MHLATKSYFHIQRMHNDLRAFLITHLIQAIESFYLCYTTTGEIIASIIDTYVTIQNKTKRPKNMQDECGPSVK